MATAASIFAKLVLDATDYKKGVADAKKDTKTLTDSGGKGLGGLGDAFKNVTGFTLGMAGAVSFAGVAIAKTAQFLGECEKAAAAANVVMAKQEAILKATGYSAGLSADQLDVMAQSSSKLTGIDDELIANSQSVLLTFREIKGEDGIFDRALNAALDLQTTFGNLETSSVQVGKALNDPVGGVTALAKAGVQFTDVQKKMIKGFVETNQIAKAQDIILSEIEHQVGGTAAAMEAASDGTNRLTNATENYKESVGQGLVPLKRKWNDYWAGILETDVATMSLAEKTEALGFETSAMGDYWKDGKVYSKDYVLGLVAIEEASNSAALSTNGLGAEIVMTEDELKAMTQTSKDMISMVNSLTTYEQSYNDTLKNLTDERVELETKRADLVSQGYSQTGEDILEIDRKLAENQEAVNENADNLELATNKMILSYAQQLLAADGLTTEEATLLIEQGVSWGVYSQTAADKMNEVIAKSTELNDSIANITSSKEITITTSLVTNHVDNYYVSGSQGTAINRRANGGSTIAGQMYEVTENGTPEMLTVNNKNYLMMGSQDGYVTPMKESGGNNNDSQLAGALASLSATQKLLPNQIARAIRQNGKYS